MSGRFKNAGKALTPVYDVGSLGGGLKLVSRETVDFSHAKAFELLNLEEFVGDRYLKQAHVDYLVQAMVRGTFHPEWVSIIVCKCDGRLYRMNGQHTAWARLEMPIDWPCEVEYLTYEAQTANDMRELYASIDRSSPRTKANVIASYLVGTEEFEGVRGDTLRRLPHGFALWMWPSRHERNRHDGDDVAYLMRTDHYDLSKKVAAFLDQFPLGELRHVFRGPVLGAMFATFHKAPQVSIDFWRPVVEGTGIDKRNDPRLRLRNELLQTSVSLGAGNFSPKKKMSQELMFRLCVTAWNAFREDRPLQVLRATEKGRRSSVK